MSAILRSVYMDGFFCDFLLGLGVVKEKKRISF